jgi:hypothetical protein
MPISSIVTQRDVSLIRFCPNIRGGQMNCTHTDSYKKLYFIRDVCGALVNMPVGRGVVWVLSEVTCRRNACLLLLTFLLHVADTFNPEDGGHTFLLRRLERDRRLRLQSQRHLSTDCLYDIRSATSQNSTGLHSLLRRSLYFLYVDDFRYSQIRTGLHGLLRGY